MPTLQVPGAELFYETFGSGPLLLLIAGIHGTGAVFHRAARFLARSYTVVCWDRRGYSKSFVGGTQITDHRLFADFDDGCALIKHLSTKPALVFANSTGTIVAQKLLLKHPEWVRTVVVHEPPSHFILPDQIRPHSMAQAQGIYDAHRTLGPSKGVESFIGVGGAYEDGDESILLHSMDIT